MKYDPVAHPSAGWQSRELLVMENVKSGHSPHREFANTAHGVLTNWPGTQVVHARGAVSPGASQ
jgi:hypothetical protein